MSRTYQVSPYEFNEKKLKRAYEMFEKARPEIIKGNTAMIVEFAESIEKNCWDKPKIPIAFCSQNTMRPEYIETLKRVFGSQVYNAYGATESGIVAAQCTEGEGLHYIPVRHYLETLSDGKQTTAGKTGSLIITSLTRYAMPIIRFQIGDYATPTDKKCPCGRTFPMLESIDGRLYEIINTPIGTVVSVYEVMTVIRKIEKIVDYQMVKENPDSVSLYLVISDGKLTAEENASLKTDLLKLFECKMNIWIKYVPGITKLPSGKILRILSKERYDEARTSESRV